MCMLFVPSYQLRSFRRITATYRSVGSERGTDSRASRLSEQTTGAIVGKVDATDPGGLALGHSGDAGCDADFDTAHATTVTVHKA